MSVPITAIPVHCAATVREEDKVTSEICVYLIFIFIATGYGLDGPGIESR